MNIVNVMWSGGAPYMSVHSVHRQMLDLAGTDATIDNWLLLGNGLCSGIGSTREWHMPKRALKERGVWRLLMPWLRARTRKALHEARPDALLLDGMGVARLILPLLGAFPNTRVTLLFHGATHLRAADIRLLRAVPAERMSIAAVSQTLARALELALERPVQPLRIALDPASFANDLLDRQQARQALGLSHEAGCVFGAVGRLVHSKGFEMLIDAFAKARVSRPQARLVMLGEGELKDSLQARADALGLGDSFVLCGYRPDLKRLYRAFDYLLVPSRSEGLGLVLQEAVLADVPVLCSDLPVFREQLADAGHYLPVGDPAAWAQALEHCGQPGDVAARQRRALAPEAAWQSFRQASIKVLRG